MEKRNLLLMLCVLIFGFCNVNAQVRGLSYTISPVVERTWWDEKSGLADGFLGGLQLGFGFGENVELRGNYMQSYNLLTDISRFGLDNPIESLLPFDSRDVKITRYGGDIKFNLSRGAIVPYLTLGTGIQSVSYDTLMPSKQIYVDGGIGVNFTVADRYTIGIQGVNNRFRFNPATSLLDANDRTMLEVDPTNFPSFVTSNYSLKASLIVYLGGRRPGQQTDIDKAYWDNFSGGFSGLSIPIEPTFSRMNFNPALPYKDTYMAGLSAGFNFGPLVGVRGFYWKALEEESFTKFDDLAIYGGEARFKLNEGRGFTPWITLGGGNIVSGEEYSGNIDSLAFENKVFAMGGVGLDLPFSKYVKATGFARYLLTTSQNLEQVGQPDELNYSLNYGVSLNFILGKRKEKVEVVKQSAFDEYILNSETENEAAKELLILEYENRIAKLDSQKTNAILDQDQETLNVISSEKKKAEKILTELEKKDRVIEKRSNDSGIINGGGSIIRMTPAEFQLLIQEMKRGGNTSQTEKSSQNDMNNAISDMNTEIQMKELTKDLQELKSELRNLKEDLSDENYRATSELSQQLERLSVQISDIEKAAARTDRTVEIVESNQRELERSIGSADNVTIESADFAKIRMELENANARIDEIRSSQYNYEDAEDNIDYERLPNDGEVSNKTIIQNAASYDNSGKFLNKLKYNGMSGFAGFNVGGNATFNLGYRLHYKIDSTNFEFVPESFFGFGSPSSFGITANIIYNLDKLTKSKYINPYIGVGGGFMKVGNDENVDKLSGAYNFIAGTYLNVWAGDLYVDFTARNLFKYNQVVVGYRFPF